MNNKSKLFKYMSVPLVFLVIPLAFASYMAWKEHRINNDLIEQALKGNQFAVEILIKYEKPWKLDETLVHEALDGNVYAIRVLGINKSRDLP